MISVVIPCHNEEKGVKEVIPRLPQGAEVIVVDNNCSDRTAEVARGLGARVVMEKVPGYGAAIKKGLTSATGELVVVLDGDSQYPAEKINAALAFLRTRKLDFVSCNRFPLQDKSAMTLMRRLGNWVLTTAANVLFGLRLNDSQSGMWVFKREVLNKIKLENVSMPFSEEIKIKAATHPEITFGEFHVPYIERLGASSLSPWKHGWQNLLYLLRLRCELWQSPRRIK